MSIALNKIVNKTSARFWTDAEIKAFPSSMWQALSTYAPGLNKAKKGLKELLEPKAGVWGQADALYAGELSRKKERSTAATKTLAETVIHEGGAIKATRDTMSYIMAMETVEMDLTVIPVEITPGRKGLDAMAVIVGSVLRLSEGDWRCVEPAIVDTLAKQFKTILPREVQYFGLTCAGLMNEVPEWKSMALKTRQGMGKAPETVKKMLAAMPDVEYRYLSSHWVGKVMQAFYKDSDGDWCITQSGNGDLVPSSVYTQQKVRREEKEYYKDIAFPLEYNGGWVPPAAPEKRKEYDLEALQTLAKTFLPIMGGSDRVISRIMYSQGFSGLVEDQVRKLLLQVSMVLGVWQKGKVANLVLTKDSDATVLYSLLSYHKDMIKKQIVLKNVEATEKFGVMSKNEGNWVNYVMTSREAKNAVPSSMRPHVFTRPQDGVCVMYTDEKGLKAKKDKLEKVDHDVNSDALVDDLVGREFVVYGPIYGRAFFSNDQAVLKAQVGRTTDDHTWVPGTVLGYGTAVNYQGIFTSFSTFNLLGTENDEYVTIPLVAYKTQAEWYKKIGEAIISARALFWKANAQYSCITNLFVILKEKLVLINNLFDHSETVNVAFPTGINKKKIVVVSDDQIVKKVVVLNEGTPIVAPEKDVNVVPPEKVVKKKVMVEEESDTDDEEQGDEESEEKVEFEDDN